MDFLEALTTVYLHSPCQVLPNALWKTRSQVHQHVCSFQIDGQSISELSISNQDQLLLYWKPGYQHLDYCRFGSPKLALIHQQALPHFPADTYLQKTAYFRYMHPMKGLNTLSPVAGFSLMDAEPANQAPQIAQFLNRCYTNMSIDAETIINWCHHPTYQDNLWLWVLDNKTAQPVALGIAEFDPEMKEGSLEWIQVLPEYRRQGLGKLVVDTLLHRLQEIARFTTVSGRVENPSQPGSLYRKCGFIGDDIWWVFQKTI